MAQAVHNGYLTDRSERRHAILESIAQWPVNRWIEFDEAWRFLLASGNGFLVTSEAVTLYFAEQQYGHLGGHEHVLPRVYLRVFLMEILATLGIIDIAYSYPHHLWPDFDGGWGTDEMSFCSRYDGLLYVRLNALGAYCLNVTPHYESTPVRTNILGLPQQARMRTYYRLQIGIFRQQLRYDFAFVI